MTLEEKIRVFAARSEKGIKIMSANFEKRLRKLEETRPRVSDFCVCSGHETTITMLQGDNESTAIFDERVKTEEERICQRCEKKLYGFFVIISDTDDEGVK